MYQFKIQIIPILNFLVCKILRERGLIFVTVSDRMREGVSILPKMFLIYKSMLVIIHKSLQ